MKKQFLLKFTNSIFIFPYQKFWNKWFIKYLINTTFYTSLNNNKYNNPHLKFSHVFYFINKTC